MAIPIAAMVVVCYTKAAISSVLCLIVGKHTSDEILSVLTSSSKVEGFRGSDVAFRHNGMCTKFDIPSHTAVR